MKKTYFFDMDGTLARFYKDKNCLTNMSKENYFAKLLPYGHLVNFVKLLIQRGEKVYILSACVPTKYCAQEKIGWIKKFIPDMPIENILLLECGQSKSETVKNIFYTDIVPNMILIDDYSANIYDWEQNGGTAIKFINEVNNGSGKNYNYKFSNIKELRNILNNLGY